MIDFDKEGPTGILQPVMPLSCLQEKQDHKKANGKYLRSDSLHPIRDLSVKYLRGTQPAS